LFRLVCEQNGGTLRTMARRHAAARMIIMRYTAAHYEAQHAICPSATACYVDL